MAQSEALKKHKRTIATRIEHLLVSSLRNQTIPIDRAKTIARTAARELQMSITHDEVAAVVPRLAAAYTELLAITDTQNGAPHANYPL